MYSVEPVSAAAPIEEPHEWRLLATTYTCVHPADMEPPASLIAEIRTFFPNFVPVWMISEWQEGKKEHQAFGQHLFASWTDTAENPDAGDPLHIQAFPADFPFRGGYIYPARPWTFTLPNADPRAYGPFAEQFLPFDHAAVDYLRATWHWLNSPGSLRQKYEESARKIEEDKFRTLASVSLEKRMQLRDDRHYLMKLIGDGKFFPEVPDGPAPFTQITNTDAWDTTPSGLVVPLEGVSS